MQKGGEEKNKGDERITESKVTVVEIFVASVSLYFVFFLLRKLFITS